VKFTLNGTKPPADPRLDFDVCVDEDGDLAFEANGVLLGYISATSGRLILFSLAEHERELVPGLSLSNGKLTVA
jgi:hypothetical protein